eukprot:1528129-Rhodomonas_salina.2
MAAPSLYNGGAFLLQWRARGSRCRSRQRRPRRRAVPRAGAAPLPSASALWCPTLFFWLFPLLFPAFFLHFSFFFFFCILRLSSLEESGAARRGSTADLTIGTSPRLFV